MSGEIQSKQEPQRRKVRKRKKRRKQDPKVIGDVQKEKIYMVIFLMVVATALIGLVGWGLWVMIKNLLNTYG